MTLTRLKSPEAAARWLRSWVTGTLRTDSRQVCPGDAFIAWPGHVTDGRRHVRQALDAGASTCLVEDAGIDAFGFDDARIATLPGMKAATGGIADAYFESPSKRLLMVAATGTNGKTSSAWWTAQALTLLGRRCAVMGTLGIGDPPLATPGAGGDPGNVQATGLTTPDPVTLHAALRRFADAGYAACALEASSIGIVEHRLAAATVDVAILTNFTRDHLDYHGSMDAYWAAKRMLFGWPGLRAAVINVDDAQGAVLAREMSGVDLWTLSTAQPARLAARDVRYVAGGLAFELHEGDASVPVRSALVGDYNAHNLLGVIGALRAAGVALADAAAIVPRLTPVPGRLQRVGDGSGPEVVVDYAHTPDALDKVLCALRPLAAARDGRLWCVFGCGGNRDATKRPLMGAIAEARADAVVVTSDNPRDEEPDAILAQISAGLTAPARVVADRRQAIRQTIAAAAPADVVLLAGKGHEDYQEVRGRRLPFSDADEAHAALAQRRGSGSDPALAQRRGSGSDPALAQRRGSGSDPALAARVRSTAMATLADAQALLPGSRLVGDGAAVFGRVHTDTRTLQPGDLYVALRGERHDGHDHVAAALQAGAAGVVAEHGDAPGLRVPDTLAALQQLAAGWRLRHALPLIAVTGSNGKTTVTQMVAAILRAARGDAAFATAGNLNNHIGVPLTLLRLRPEHRAGVVELGMNHPGEIAVLAALARPTVALVNNAQREHQEFMAGVDAVAHENGAVITALPADGIAVFPADDAHAPLWRQLAGSRRVIDFALDDGAGAQVGGSAAWLGADSGEAGASSDSGAWALSLRTPAGVVDTLLSMPGQHNVRNALAAAACALAVGVPLSAIAAGLAAFQPVAGRSQLQRITIDGRLTTLVDDSYNANPDSVLAAIRLLAALPAPRWLVLGDMGEVGNRGPDFHAEVGAAARAAGIETVWTAGTLSSHAAADAHFADAAAVVAALDRAPRAASVLVKGSRFMRMEQVVGALSSRQRPGDAR